MPNVRSDRDPYEGGVLRAVHHAGERSQIAHGIGDNVGFRSRSLTDNGPLNLPDLLDLTVTEIEAGRGGSANRLG